MCYLFGACWVYIKFGVDSSALMCVCVCAYVRACVLACVRAGVRACVCVRERERERERESQEEEWGHTGNVYSTRTGMLTAAEPGLYYFHTTFLSYRLGMSTTIYQLRYVIPAWPLQGDHDKYGRTCQRWRSNVAYFKNTDNPASHC